MKAFCCDRCGNYFPDFPIKALRFAVTDEELSALNKMFEVSIQIDAFENYSVPDLCLECFKREVIVALRKP